MSWLKTLWSWFTTPSEDTCCTQPHETVPVDTKEDEKDIQKIVYDICRGAGIPHRDIVKNRICQIFDEWYDGNADENEIRKTMIAFQEAHPKLKPKLQKLNT